MLALLGEKQGHHAVVVAHILRRADRDVHGLPLPYLDNAGCGVVKGLSSVELVGLLDYYRGQQLRCKLCAAEWLEKFNELVTAPVIVENSVLACVEDAVAHGDKNITVCQLDRGAVDSFFAYRHGRQREFVMNAVAQHDDTGVFVLDNVGVHVVHEPYDRKGRKCTFSFGAYRQSGGYGFNGIADIEPCRQHGRYYL